MLLLAFSPVSQLFCVAYLEHLFSLERREKKTGMVGEWIGSFLDLVRIFQVSLINVGARPCSNVLLSVFYKFEGS